MCLFLFKLSGAGLPRVAECGAGLPRVAERGWAQVSINKIFLLLFFFYYDIIIQQWLILISKWLYIKLEYNGIK